MMKDAQQQLKDKLAEDISFDPQICVAYNFDLGEIPAVLMSQIKSTPEAVVVVRSEQHVIETLSIANACRIPVTPRGQASSGFGGALPTQGGILLDFSEMNRVLSIDEKSLTVDVEPGVIWKQLSEKLARYDLDNCICPTSAPSATVGGWFAMGGVGIGSLRFGSIADVVEELDIVGLSGQIRTCRGADLDLYYQTCGTLGVITRLRLKCRKRGNLVPYAIELTDATKTQLFIEQLTQHFPCDSVIVHSEGYARMRHQSGHAHSLPNGYFLVIAAIPEEFANFEKLSALVEAAQGKLLPSELAKEEWADRFYPMRIKKVGPTMLVSEFYLPVKHFAAAWKRIAKDLKRDSIGMEAFAVKGNKMAVLLYVPDNSKALLYPLRMAKAIRPLQIARQYGGVPYTSGLWFAEESKEIFGAEKFAAFVRQKRMTDPHNLLNPGKIIAPKLRFLPFVSLGKMVHFGSLLASPFARLLKYRAITKA